MGAEHGRMYPSQRYQYSVNSTPQVRPIQPLYPSSLSTTVDNSIFFTALKRNLEYRILLQQGKIKLQQMEEKLKQEKLRTKIMQEKLNRMTGKKTSPEHEEAPHEFPLESELLKQDSNTMWIEDQLKKSELQMKEILDNSKKAYDAVFSVEGLRNLNDADSSPTSDY
jgi:protease II